VYLGGADGLAGAKAQLIVTPEASTGRFGAAVACAGDIDGDGRDDIVIGAPKAGKGFAGAAFVYRGAPSGVAGEVAQRIDAPTATYAFGSAAHAAGGKLAIGAPGSTGVAGSVLLFGRADKNGPLLRLENAFSSSTDVGFGAAIAMRSAPRRGRARE
jgi:hypothetical protein